MNRPYPEPIDDITGFELITDRVAVKVGRARSVTKLAVHAALDAFREELMSAVRTKKRVLWPGVGTFYVKHRKARRISNPQTREPMTLPANWSIGFRAAKAQKELLNA